jgi:hypothetical protein
MKRFEYLTALNPTLEDQNGLGSYGWELITVTTERAGKLKTFYYKRQM